MPRTRWPWLIALALVLSSSQAAHAQEEAPLPPEVVDDVALDPLNQRRNVFEVQAQQFDTYVFRTQVAARVAVAARVGGGINIQQPAREILTPRDQLDAKLSQKILEVENLCDLTSTQREKLRLAGRGDIHHFFGQVEEKRRQFEDVRKDQARFMQFYQNELLALRNAFARGVFEDGSLFAKSLSHILDPAQAARYQRTLREREAAHFTGAVDLLAARLGLAMGLSADQRVRFSRVILDNTRVPKSLGTQEFNAALFLASTVPAEKFKDILDDAQMRVLERQLQSRRNFEQVLKQQGFVPGDEPREKGSNP